MSKRSINKHDEKSNKLMKKNSNNIIMFDYEKIWNIYSKLKNMNTK